MTKVSVIIPVYNGERYLRQCLDSVCGQTLEEIEVICVDDGSTDGSWEILEEYGQRDPRFVLIHQENLHVSAARNNGFARAGGKYVIFWDCDDFFEPDALELLYQRAEETGAEICVCSNDLYNNRTGKIAPDGMPLNLKRVPEGEPFNRFTNPEHILSFTNAMVWNKLFLREFLEKNNISYQDFGFAEDVPFTLVCLCVASRIATVNKVLIHYRWNNLESLVGKSSQLSREGFRAIEYAADQLIERDVVPSKSFARRMLQIIKANWQRVATEADFINVFNICSERGGVQVYLQNAVLLSGSLGIITLKPMMSM